MELRRGFRSGMRLHSGPELSLIHICLQGDAADDQGVAHRVDKQRANEAWVEDLHGDDHRWRQSHEQHHSESALSRVDADLAQDFEALADDVREVVEDLCEIAPSFALQHHGGHKKFHIDQRNAVSEIEQGIADGQAEFLLFVELAKLSGDRLGDFVGDHFERGGKGVSGANGAGEGVDGFGKFLFKRCV